MIIVSCEMIVVLSIIMNTTMIISMIRSGTISSSNSSSSSSSSSRSTCTWRRAFAPRFVFLLIEMIIIGISISIDVIGSSCYSV